MSTLLIAEPPAVWGLLGNVRLAFITFETSVEIWFNQQSQYKLLLAEQHQITLLVSGLSRLSGA